MISPDEGFFDVACNLSTVDDFAIEDSEIFDPLSSMLNKMEGEGSAERVDIEDLESMVRTRKYLPLARILLQEEEPSVQFTFAQLETTIDAHLPPAARKYRQWWANERGRHVQASSWLGVGWKVDSVDLIAGTVAFHKVKA